MHIPDAAIKYWDMFKGSRLKDDDKMLKSDYEEFVGIIQKKVDTGNIEDAEVETWLEFQ